VQAQSWLNFAPAQTLTSWQAPAVFLQLLTVADDAFFAI
jgi:hypothetical protein